MGYGDPAARTIPYADRGIFGFDTHVFYMAGQQGDLYNAPLGDTTAYLYSPLFAQIIRPMAQLLPWPAFLGFWVGVEAVAYAWLLWPLRWRWRVLAYLYVVPALFIGNIFGVLGLVLVLCIGRRIPEAWAYPLLTKVAPAGVGVVWHAVRGEWGSIVRAGVVTVALVGVSAAVDWQAWMDWLAFLAANSGVQPWRPVQLVIALAVAAYAAKTNRPWLLVVAFWLSAAIPVYVQAWGALAPIVRLSGRRAAGGSPPAEEASARRVRAVR